MVAEFTVPGRPQGKARARTVRLPNGKISTYTPKATREYEMLVKACYLEQCGRRMFPGAVKLSIEASFPIPKGTSKKKAGEMIGKPYLHKPDSDNIIKAIADGLNGIAYPDDSAIYTVSATKVYAGEGKVCVKIVTEDEEDNYEKL